MEILKTIDDSVGFTKAGRQKKVENEFKKAFSDDYIKQCSATFNKVIKDYEEKAKEVPKQVDVRVIDRSKLDPAGVAEEKVQRVGMDILMAHAKFFFSPKYEKFRQQLENDPNAFGNEVGENYQAIRNLFNSADFKDFGEKAKDYYTNPFVIAFDTDWTDFIPVLGAIKQYERNQMVIKDLSTVSKILGVSEKDAARWSNFIGSAGVAILDLTLIAKPLALPAVKGGATAIRETVTTIEKKVQPALSAEVFGGTWKTAWMKKAPPEYYLTRIATEEERLRNLGREAEKLAARRTALAEAREVSAESVLGIRKGSLTDKIGIHFKDFKNGKGEAVLRTKDGKIMSLKYDKETGNITARMGEYVKPYSTQIKQTKEALNELQKEVDALKKSGAETKFDVIRERVLGKVDKAKEKIPILSDKAKEKLTKGMDDEIKKVEENIAKLREEQGEIRKKRMDGIYTREDAAKKIGEVDKEVEKLAKQKKELTDAREYMSKSQELTAYKKKVEELEKMQKKAVRKGEKPIEYEGAEIKNISAKDLEGSTFLVPPDKRATQSFTYAFQQKIVDWQTRNAGTALGRWRELLNRRAVGMRGGARAAEDLHRMGSKKLIQRIKETPAKISEGAKTVLKTKKKKAAGVGVAMVPRVAGGAEAITEQKQVSEPGVKFSKDDIGKTREVMEKAIEENPVQQVQQTTPTLDYTKLHNDIYNKIKTMKTPEGYALTTAKVLDGFNEQYNNASDDRGKVAVLVAGIKINASSNANKLLEGIPPEIIQAAEKISGKEKGGETRKPSEADLDKMVE